MSLQYHITINWVRDNISNFHGEGKTGITIYNYYISVCMAILNQHNCNKSLRLLDILSIHDNIKMYYIITSGYFMIQYYYLWLLI